MLCLHVFLLSPAKPLRLATAYTSYGAADKIIRRLTAYEVRGGLWRLTAAARGSNYRTKHSTMYTSWHTTATSYTALFIITTMSFDARFFYIHNSAFYPLNPQKISAFRLHILSVVTSAHPHFTTG